MDKVFIIAGTRQEARAYALGNDLGDDWLWVDDPTSFNGHTTSKVILTGNFTHRNNIKDLLEAVKARGLPWQHEPWLFAI